MAKDDKSGGGSHADDRDYGKKGGGSGTFGKPQDQGKDGGGKHGGGDGGKKK
jgi:hypothetical protein